jgi:pimeloyl-ACP methyl ester carboxylesterase
MAFLEFLRLVQDPIYTAAAVPRGEGRPVLVIPGFLSPDATVGALTAWLRRAGYTTVAAQLGLNLSCSERALAGLEGRLESAVNRHGFRAAVIGHSRGGTFARVLAVRRPDLVAGVVTIATPPMGLTGVHPVVRLPLRALALAGLVRSGCFFGNSCFSGECCRRFRDDLVAPLEAGVPFTAIGARRDGLVPSAACRDPQATAADVDASHLGSVVNADVFRVLVSALARVSDVDRDHAARQALSLAA